jgi:hypothetical protein
MTTIHNENDDNGNPTIPDISTKLSGTSLTDSTKRQQYQDQHRPAASPPPPQPPQEQLSSSSTEYPRETAKVAFADVDEPNPDPQLECNSSVEIVHQEDKQPEISKFHDHFTLLIPSSTIRYREGRAAARVLEANDAQFVLEETYDKEKDRHSVSIRRIHDTSEGVRVLRTSYLIVTAFWTGFLFVFCLQILLFLFLDLAIQAGATSKQAPNWGKAIGT